ncbi:polysaccharide deacetylase family protein [Ekhidna sp.]
MKTTLFTILICFLGYCEAQNRRMCVTVDDLPAVHYGLNNRAEITDGLLATFIKYEVPAIGYVNEGKLYKDGVLDQQRVAYLEQWLKSGLELGNHSFSHMNYHKNSLEAFGEDILKGEQIIKPLSEKYQRKVQYFRHPYLRSGATKETSNSLKEFLQSNGYIEAPVTIDNEEYLFAKAYAVAIRKGDKEQALKVAESYLEYMTLQQEYYEKASNDLLGRNMDHILLIHANLLNAHYLDELLDIYKEKGYEFISQEAALKYPAYQLEVTIFDDWGISWIHRWGMSKGLKGDFFKGEAVTPEFIKEPQQ